MSAMAVRRECVCALGARAVARAGAVACMTRVRATDVANG